MARRAKPDPGGVTVGYGLSGSRVGIILVFVATVLFLLSLFDLPAAAPALTATSDRSSTAPALAATIPDPQSPAPTPSNTLPAQDPAVQVPTELWPTPTPTIGLRVATTHANFRAGPGLHYPALGTLKAGTVAEILGRSADNGWFNVRTREGRRGWLSSMVVYLFDDAAAYALPVAATIPAPPPTTP